MKAKRESAPRQAFLLLGATGRRQKTTSLPAQVATSVAGLQKLLARATKDSLWISYARPLTEALLRRVSWPTLSIGNAVLIHDMAPETLSTLANCFQRFAYSTKDGFLPIDELVEALAARNRADLFVGGIVDDASQTITLWRGNLESLTVPFATFAKSGDGIVPDFTKFTIGDYGQTIRLGAYEAASDAILYEFDPEYRRRISKQRQQSEQSFGAALRRLRKQRGLRREDFAPGVAAKTIARIEQGLVKRVQKKTLDVLAQRLQVRPEEIASF